MRQARAALEQKLNDKNRSKAGTHVYSRERRVTSIHNKDGHGTTAAPGRQQMVQSYLYSLRLRRVIRQRVWVWVQVQVQGRG
jgi:hypothetical protein